MRSVGVLFIFAGVAGCNGRVTDASVTDGGTRNPGAGATGAVGGARSSTAVDGGAGARSGVGASGGTGAMGGARANVVPPFQPPPGPYDCRKYTPEEFTDPRKSRCVPPPEPVPPNCYNACWDSPGAPGPEGCPPSFDERAKNCCGPGFCSLDWGGGCTVLPRPLEDESVASAIPCGPPSTQAERLYTGRFDKVVVSGDVIALATYGTDSHVTFIPQQTCEAVERFLPFGVSDIAATPDAVYVFGNRDTTRTSLFKVTADGEATEVPLAELFGGAEVAPAGFASQTVSAYWPTASPGGPAYVTVRVPTDAAEDEVALVVLPCCGRAPEIVARRLPEWLYGRDLFVYGNTLVAVQQMNVLDHGPISTVGVLGLSSMKADLLFDNLDFAAMPSVFDYGSFYFVRGPALVRFNVETCTSETLADHPAAGITAIAADGPDVFWAESYGTGGLGSRVFLVRPATAERRLLQFDGYVSSMVLDSKNLYLAIGKDGTAEKTLVRTKRR